MPKGKSKKAAELLDAGLDLLLNQNASGALKALKEAFEAEPGNGKIVSALALCYSILNDRQKAIELYKKAIELLPEDTKNYYCLGRLYMEENKQVEAMSVLSNGIFRCKEKLKDAPELETYLDLAKIHAFQAQHDESILTLFKALAINDKNSEVYRMMAEEYFNLSLYREAIIEAEKAIKLNDRDSDALLYIGLSYHKLNVIDRALTYFGRSLSINPNQPELKSLHDKLIELKSQNGPTVEETIYNAKPDKKYTGVVKWFNDDNGIGYIKRNDDGAEIFVHYLSIARNGYQSLYEGAEVEFSAVPSHTGQVAINVRDISKVKPKLKHGKVKWFDDERGVGEILLDGGDTALVHYTAIPKDGIKTLRQNERVECELFESENGLQAFNVCDEKISAESEMINEASDTNKFMGKVKWLDKNKNIGIIDEISGSFQAIFKISEALENHPQAKSLKTGTSVRFEILNVEALENENIKKAINIEVLS